MDEAIREFLKAEAEKNGYSTDDDTLIELLMGGEEVWSGEEDRHRWWTCYTRVVKVNDKFFSFQDAETTGDDSARDKGWEFDPETIYEVRPETRPLR